jgi:hemolysin activation/secretion protein
VELALDQKQFDVTEINGVPLPGQRIRKTLPLSLGYSARVESDIAVWGYNASFALNMPAAGAEDLQSYQSEDPRVSTVRWRALRGAANYATGIFGNWLWSLRGQFQYSPDALISGEQFGLGGASSVRGTTERPVAGDSGALVSTELTSPELMSGLRLVGFVDAGWLSNNTSNGNSKPANDALSSVGLGLRYAAANYSLTADYGRIVTGSSLPSVANSALPQSGDQKLHITVSARF